MKLVLFTNFFPYRRSEPFLIPEFDFTRQHTSKLKLFTLYGNSGDCTVDPSICFEPVLGSPEKRAELLFKGIFNLSPAGFHLKELWLKKLILKPSKLYWWMVSLLLTRATMASGSYKKLINHLQQNPGTLLYFYWGDNLSRIIPYLVKKLNNQNLKIIVRHHGSDIYEELKSDYSPLRKDIFENSSRLYVVSEFGRRYLEKKYPQFSSKFLVSRLGVKDTGEGPFVPGRNTVLSVSNVVEVKRVNLVFEALKTLKDEITWHHFGDGPLMSQLKKLTSSAPGNLKIVLHGHVSNEQLRQFLTTEAVSVFVNVSSSEGLPVSIMEAFSYGIPVIATAVGGTPELVNEKNGALLEKDFKTAELGKAITTLLNESSTGKQGRREEARKTFLAKASFNNYELFYRELNKL